jgi:hypothetical protein
VPGVLNRNVAARGLNFGALDVIIGINERSHDSTAR